MNRQNLVEDNTKQNAIVSFFKKILNAPLWCLDASSKINVTFKELVVAAVSTVTLLVNPMRARAQEYSDFALPAENPPVLVVMQEQDDNSSFVVNEDHANHLSSNVPEGEVVNEIHARCPNGHELEAGYFERARKKADISKATEIAHSNIPILSESRAVDIREPEAPGLTIDFSKSRSLNN